MPHLQQTSSLFVLEGRGRKRIVHMFRTSLLLFVRYTSSTFVERTYKVAVNAGKRTKFDATYNKISVCVRLFVQPNHLNNNNNIIIIFISSNSIHLSMHKCRKNLEYASSFHTPNSEHK